MSNKRKVELVRAMHVTMTPDKPWECPDCNSDAVPSTTGAAYNIQHDDTCPFWTRMQDMI